MHVYYERTHLTLTTKYSLKRKGKSSVYKIVLTNVIASNDKQDITTIYSMEYNHKAGVVSGIFRSSGVYMNAAYTSEEGEFILRKP